VAGFGDGEGVRPKEEREAAVCLGRENVVALAADDERRAANGPVADADAALSLASREAALLGAGAARDDPRRLRVREVGQRRARRRQVVRIDAVPLRAVGACRRLAHLLRGRPAADLGGRARRQQDERRRLEGLTTFNSLDSGRTDIRPEDQDRYGTPIQHPMVRTHPVHGSRAVYFHVSKATHIDGMAPGASHAFMAGLLDRMIRPEIVYHHVWRRGDVLVVDNRATMHRAHGDYDRRESRVLWRIIVQGDRPRLV